MRWQSLLQLAQLSEDLNFHKGVFSIKALYLKLRDLVILFS
jgi:hypothetical protein